MKEDVRSAYLTLLKREPDPGGLASYAFELIRGHLKLEKMWVEMMESEEAREANGAEATKEELRARCARTQSRVIIPRCLSVATLRGGN